MAVVAVAGQMSAELSRVTPFFPVKVDTLVLNGAAQSLIAPSGVAWMWVKVVTDMPGTVTGTVFMRYNGTAAQPAGATQNGSDDGSASWALESSDGPQWFRVPNGGATISFFADSANVHVSWHREGGL